MAEEKSSGQWAAEAFDFLRLFRRVSRSFSGLLLVEIGWAALLFLVAKLSAADATPVVGIPWIASGGPTVQDVPLATVFTYGAAAIALVWCFTSGLYLYVSAPIAKVLRVVGVPLVIPLVIVLGVIGLPILLVSLPLEAYLYARWKKGKDAKKLEQAIKDDGEEAIRDVARKEMGFRADWLQVWMMGRGADLARTWASAGFIGLAPLYSYSYDEDLLGAKAPVQIFAEAIGRMRLKLRNLRAVQHVSFRPLPPAVRASDFRAARRVRKWLGLDALLWGSYLSTDPPMIWLNVDQALTPTEKEKQEKADDAEVWRDGNPFSDSLDPDAAAFIVDQRDSQDAYIVLLIVLIQALKRRQSGRWRLAPKWVDALYYSHADVKRIINHLIRDALFDLDAPLSPSPAPHATLTAKEMLVGIAGKWISTTVETAPFRREDRIGDQLLWEVAKKCVELLPDDPGVNYRLALVSSLLGRDEEAEAALATALKRDTSARWSGQIRLAVQAQMAMGMIRLAGVDERVEIAKAAIYTARAITFADDEESEKKQLREELMKSQYYELRQYDRSPLTGYEKILHRYLDLEREAEGT